ncbi:hypothetical protein FALCPG4_000644 [Fusarium falciforme]
MLHAPPSRITAAAGRAFLLWRVRKHPRPLVDYSEGGHASLLEEGPIDCLIDLFSHSFSSTTSRTTSSLSSSVVLRSWTPGPCLLQQSIVLSPHTRSYSRS